MSEAGPRAGFTKKIYAVVTKTSVTLPMLSPIARQDCRKNLRCLSRPYLDGFVRRVLVLLRSEVSDRNLLARWTALLVRARRLHRKLPSPASSPECPPAMPKFSALRFL
jgi:hypothetical protein